METIWQKLQTEQPNHFTENLDSMSTFDILTTMNDADQTVALAVKQVIPEVARAVDIIVQRLSSGGRLFYMGAGTSGRLGILDAAECPPTFNTHPELIQALIAGGETAVFRAVEAAEDSREQGESDLKEKGFSNKDVVVGIAASGRTPYVMGGLTYARACGGATISLTCNKGSVISQAADVAIEVEVGSEVLMGSTRLKSGTAQKLVLNMLSTGAMVKLGKVYKNLMVDLRATNHKLVERSKRIVMLATGVSYEEASVALEQADGHVKTAILMTLNNVNRVDAEAALSEANGHLRTALASCK